MTEDEADPVLPDTAQAGHEQTVLEQWKFFAQMPLRIRAYCRVRRPRGGL